MLEKPEVGVLVVRKVEGLRFMFGCGLWLSERLKLLRFGCAWMLGFASGATLGDRWGKVVGCVSYNDGGVCISRFELWGRADRMRVGRDGETVPKFISY